MKGDLRHAGVLVFDEAIGQALPQMGGAGRLGVDVDLPEHAEGAQVVETADVVVVCVSDENGVEVVDVFTINLFTQIRAGIDQQVFACVFQKNGSPQTPVAGIGGIGAVPAVEYHRCSVSRTRAQNGDFH